MRTECLAGLLAGLASLSLAAGNRLMDKGDPNLDPAWRWAQADQLCDLFSSVGGEPVRTHRGALPFFSPGNTLCNRSRPDLHPEDGWMLVHRDFGTPSAAEPFPFFTLYNRYRGLFRVMLFNAVHREGSYFLGELSFLNGRQSPSERAALFTFADDDPARSTVADYDPDLVLSAVSKMTAYGSWAVFDFPLLGYDPALPGRDPVLVFKLVSVEKQALNLKGTGGVQLFQTFEAGERARPGFLSAYRRTKGAVASGYALMRRGQVTYQTVEDFLQNEFLSPAAREQHGGEAWFKAAAGLAASRFGSYLPYLGVAYAVLDTFVGGANQASEWEPLTFAGQLQLDTEGLLQTRRDLWCHTFALNPGRVDEGGVHRPLQEVPWGLFGLLELPAIRRTGTPYSRDNWNGVDATVRLEQGPSVTFNPASGLLPTSTRVAFITNDLRLEGRGDRSRAAASPFMTLQEARAGGYAYDQRTETVRVVALLWEFRFRVQAPTRFADPEVVVLKRTGFRDLGEEEARAGMTALRDRLRADPFWGRFMPK